jgi:hypothetical protein
VFSWASDYLTYGAETEHEVLSKLLDSRGLYLWKFHTLEAPIPLFGMALEPPTALPSYGFVLVRVRVPCSLTEERVHESARGERGLQAERSGKPTCAIGAGDPDFSLTSHTQIETRSGGHNHIILYLGNIDPCSSKH